MKCIEGSNRMLDVILSPVFLCQCLLCVGAGCALHVAGSSPIPRTKACVPFIFRTLLMDDHEQSIENNPEVGELRRMLQAFLHNWGQI